MVEQPLELTKSKTKGSRPAVTTIYLRKAPNVKPNYMRWLCFFHVDNLSFCARFGMLVWDQPFKQLSD
jgi:hypothetical protein